MNRVVTSEMRGSAKAVAMLDLWASVKRARDEVPRDRGGAVDREEEPRPDVAPAGIAPAIAPAE